MREKEREREGGEEEIPNSFEVVAEDDRLIIVGRTAIVSS